MNQQILRLPDVARKTGLPSSTIYRYMKEKIFPQPINLGARNVGWLLSDVENWIEERISNTRNN